MKRPNLFVVGAAKAGTTALFAHLGQHPSIDMCANKEPHWFGRDTGVPSWVRTITTFEQYLSRSSAGPEVQWIGDASPSYLPSKTAPAEVRDFAPDAKVVVVLRDPADAFASLHSHWVREGLEGRRDPGLAWDAAVAAGSRAVLFPSRRGDITDYPRWVSYGAQVGRWIDTFGPDAVLVLRNEELRADLQAAVDRVFDHLGVASIPVNEATEVNVNQAVLLPRVQRALTLLRTSGRVPDAVARRIRRVQRQMMRPAPRAPLAPAVADAVRARQADDLLLLEERLGVDLGAWRGVR